MKGSEEYCAVLLVGVIRPHLYCGRPSPVGALDSATRLCKGCAVQCQRPKCCRWVLEKGCTTVQAVLERIIILPWMLKWAAGNEHEGKFEKRVMQRRPKRNAHGDDIGRIQRQ